MKILLVGRSGVGSLGLSYLRAFLKAGCQVSQFAYDQEYESISFFTQSRLFNVFFRNRFYKILNQRFLAQVEAEKPELIFVIKGPFLFAETLSQVRNDSKALLFHFNPDNPFNENRGASNANIRATIPFYDCYFIWGKFLIPQLYRAGAKCVEYLPFGWDPELHHPVDVAGQDRRMYQNDIVFIGTWEREREAWLEALADYDLAIWGNLWGRVRKRSPLRAKWKGREAVGESFCKISSASKIVLNFIRKQNGDAHNMRTFETAGCQGFALSTRTLEQSEFFEEGKEMGFFSTPEELRSRVARYLEDDDGRRTIRANAFRKVQTHTYAERCKSILHVYSRMRGS